MPAGVGTDLHEHGGQREKGEADLHDDIVGEGGHGAALEHLLHTAAGWK